MSWDASQEGVHGSLPTKGQESWRQPLSSERFPLEPEPGERFGGPDGRRYELLEWMGGGGMGDVFRARDEMLRREVAIKFLLPRAGFAELALREARAVARLDHENIVRIFDVGEWRSGPGAPGVPFLVMECLEGEPLSALLKRGRLEVGRALGILDSIAAALESAHGRGIVHRDLKPGNVFLTRDGTVKLVDFGLAHLMEPSAENAPLLPMQGTPPYMAPEQWLGEAQDARTDLWAAGVVLYEMLTGAPPLAGLSSRQLRQRVISPEPMPPVRARNPEVPPEVESFLVMALAKEPARRFPSACELRRELRELRVRLARPGFEASGPRRRLRRQLVLLSCQLTGLSGLAGRLDAEDLGELETAFHQACEELLRPHGGGIHLALGSEVIACFGFPQVREDDAERAVHAALHLAHELPALLLRKLPHLGLSGLGARVGLHTDRMVLDKHAMQGEAPRVVSWLAEHAGPGEVLASEAARSLVRGAFETEALGARAFTGLTGPARLGVHRVLRERQVQVRFERTLVAGGLTPLVGRERELGQLLSLWERAREGQGAFVLVRGEAGIGKSRLLEELRERVPEETALRLRFQCWSRLGASALPPVTEVLEQLVQLSPGSSPQRHMAEVEAQLGALGLESERVQLLALLLSLPVPQDAPVFRLTPERRQEESYAALVELLLCVARRRPVFAVVEDLHWADSSWLGFLGLLFEYVEGERLLVVLSARPEFQPTWSARPWFHPLVLERLPAGLSEALVKEVARGGALSEATVQHLVEKTDGIPLFIEEMTRMALASGEVASIPVSLHELLLARMDLLLSGQKALAQLGAVVGRKFSLELLAALTEREPTDLRRELAGLVEAGLLQEVREGLGGPGFQFRHALFQDAAYQSLPRTERRAHHRHIARVLEERFPSVVEARPEVLAHHLTEAGELAAAIVYWRRAGVRALQHMIIPETVRDLTQALELLSSLPEPSRHFGEELQVLTILGYSQAVMQGFGSPEAARTYARAWELLRRLDELTPQLGPCVWDVFSYHQVRAEFRQSYELAELVVRQGERQRSLELLAVGYWMMAMDFAYWGRANSALEYSERAMGYMRSTREQNQGAVPRGREASALILPYASLVLSVSGRVEQAREYGRESLRVVRRLGEPLSVVRVLTITAMACLFRRDAQEALLGVDEAIAISSERSYWVWPVWARLIRGWVLSELGQQQEGLVLAQQSLARLRTLGWRVMSTYALGVLAGIDLKLGELHTGLGVVHEALEVARETGERGFEAELHRLRGGLLYAEGQEPEARESFLRARAVARQQGAGLFELRATVSLCRQLRDTGCTAEARRLLEEACTRFAPGGDCVDLQEARALLAGLAGGGGPPS